MAEYLKAIFMLFVFILPFIFLLIKSKTWRNGGYSYPPGPRGLPILGYLPFLRSDLHKQLAELAEKFGPIFKLWLGSKLCVIISSPLLIKEIVRDQDLIFANRDAPMSAIVATGGEDIVWAPYGPYWRAMRKLFVREMLSNKNLDFSYGLRKDEIKKVVVKIYSETGNAIDVGQLIFETEMNVTMNLLWGGTSDEEKNDRFVVEFLEAMEKYVKLLGKPNLSDFFPVLAKFDIQGVAKETKAAVAIFDKIFNHVIDERMKMMMETAQMEKEELETKTSRKDFLHILLELKAENDPERSVSVSQIKAILLDIVIGGTDTTATTVEWVMTELMLNPDIMKKVQQELIEVVGMENEAEESHIPKLVYLDAVVKEESLRLHPTVPLLLSRSPSKSSTIGGFTVPKGCRVLLNMWSVHLNPQFWDNPTEFKPERFLNESGNFDYGGNSFNYLPFGSGRRVCPGILLAERMVIFLLATLLHSFDWTMAQGDKLDANEAFGIVLRKKTPLVVIPSQRLLDVKFYQ